jgi:hypothetical protein
MSGFAGQCALVRQPRSKIRRAWRAAATHDDMEEITGDFAAPRGFVELRTRGCRPFVAEVADKRIGYDFLSRERSSCCYSPLVKLILWSHFTPKRLLWGKERRCRRAKVHEKKRVAD